MAAFQWAICIEIIAKSIFLLGANYPSQFGYGGWGNLGPGEGYYMPRAAPYAAAARPTVTGLGDYLPRYPPSGVYQQQPSGGGGSPTHLSPVVAQRRPESGRQHASGGGRPYSADVGRYGPGTDMLCPQSYRYK
jgi:hypothetical protein